MIAVAVAQKSSLFNCATCQWGRYCDEEMELPGSRGKAPFAKWGVRGLEEEFFTCLLPMVTRKSRELIAYHVHYKNGYLPNPGGMLNQPAILPEAMRIIETAINTKE